MRRNNRTESLKPWSVDEDEDVFNEEIDDLKRTEQRYHGDDSGVFPDERNVGFLQ